VKELEKISRPRDAKKGSEIAESLAPLTDVLLGEALAAMLYAADLGDPDGPTLLGADVSRRHDFGFREVDSTRRQRVRWARPVPEVEMETPWHLRGSLLGLDVALGRLSMKRVDLEMPLKPALPSNDREGFLYSYALINAHALHDADAAAISASIARGGARVDTVTDEQAAAALAADVHMDGWRTRALRWTVRHDRARARSYFALPELMILGGQHDLSAFDAWGSAGTSLNGCFCLALAPSHQWRLLSGRQQLGVMAIPTPDLTLRIAVLVNDLHVPAVLAKTVAAAAMLNYVDSVRPNHPDDWLTVARGAGELTREQVEDYVAAAAADGPLIPVDDDKTAASEPGR
jgi:hypothetical protein